MFIFLPSTASIAANMLDFSHSFLLLEDDSMPRTTWDSYVNKFKVSVQMTAVSLFVYQEGLQDWLELVSVPSLSDSVGFFISCVISVLIRTEF